LFVDGSKKKVDKKRRREHLENPELGQVKAKRPKKNPTSNKQQPKKNKKSPTSNKQKSKKYKIIRTKTRNVKTTIKNGNLFN
jgi:hypothetical protein